MKEREGETRKDGPGSDRRRDRREKGGEGRGTRSEGGARVKGETTGAGTREGTRESRGREGQKSRRVPLM
jgi:hypothetical protein